MERMEQDEKGYATPDHPAGEMPKDQESHPDYLMQRSIAAGSLALLSGLMQIISYSLLLEGSNNFLPACAFPAMTILLGFSFFADCRKYPLCRVAPVFLTAASFFIFTWNQDSSLIHLLNFFQEDAYVFVLFLPPYKVAQAVAAGMGFAGVCMIWSRRKWTNAAFYVMGVLLLASGYPAVKSLYYYFVMSSFSFRSIASAMLVLVQPLAVAAVAYPFYKKWDDTIRRRARHKSS